MADNRNSYTIPVNTYFPYVIPGATVDYAGVMTADQVILLYLLAAGGGGPKVYTNAARPPANDPQFAATLLDGRVGVIWNSTDKQPNYTDGTNWYDANGNLT